ncbi:c-type cytochrome [Herbaspirillum sp. GCM10030257]|uniref:c-type cytochrome n=1 Tax=Herbaspirillum sp. GCM10030257 TaxID=3273393 RepID=UPI003612C100
MTARMTFLLCLILVAPLTTTEVVSAQIAGGDPKRGKAAVERYGCAACHAIPGSANQGSNVGPPLYKIARRAYVGGVLPNTPDSLIRWLRNPPQVDPRTTMPNLGVSEMDAKDIASYLYTLD